MTSSMLAGERRWASARRGGMIVLGKVPKPINLPSQKLENHGLDPNVEIVPKGSLSWGSRPSSSTSNPWGASAVSPNSDVSPRHPSNRPTSGGGLSRPSTAGSDRAHEPSANTWGPNSRPSSASGVLTSNQSTLTTSRPLSAETRPGSSHLSRFAEPVFDNNSMAWGPNGSADKLSIPSKGNDFSLSSGDFPTLGSEKDSNAKSSDDHDSHVRPGSASGRSALAKERNEMSHPDHKTGTIETWTRDGPQHHEEKWQGEHHQYPNPNIPPQHYDTWRGPPMNAPGVWYRGPPPPAGPPYPPVPHGAFPMESFPYYRPQMPPPPLANSQAGPRGNHPRNGDFYRPQMPPDAFIRPNMPMRPGFYPGPVPYEGYFGPPMGYNHNPNPNDRDNNPFMGMPPGGPGPHGPPVYNMCPPPNSEINDPHFRGHGPVNNMFVPSEQMDSVPPPEEPRGPYKVLRKRENERSADVDEGNWEQNTGPNSLVIEKNDHQRPSFYKSDRSTDTRRNEDVPSTRNTILENPHSRNQNYPSNSKASNESWGKKSEIVTPVLEVPQDVPPNPKDPSLIQKIEGLNAKVRASDSVSGILRDEQKNKLVIQKDNSTLTFGSISNTDDLALASKSTNTSAPILSRQPHGVRKGRTGNQDNDGWRKKSPILGSEPSQNVGQVSSENLESKNTGESMVDPADGQAQRARMRELAKQRAIQLQKEEEERIKEQKAKALAKLEELNRRTLAADGTTQTAEGTTTTSVVETENVDVDQKPTEPDTELETKVEPVVQVSKTSQQEPVVEPEKPESKTVAVSVPSSTTQQRKRNNKSSKSKPRVDDVAPVPIEGEVAKVSQEPSHVEVETSSNNNNNQYNNNNKGQQHVRRMPRNPQANRSHGNDGVVWAPVKANKEEQRADESSQRSVIQDDVAKSNLKSRRAEMERYVPKAVAKELAQQGTSVEQTASPKKSVIEDCRNEEESGSQVAIRVPVTVSVDNKGAKSQQPKRNNNNQKVVSRESEVANVVSHEWDPSDGWFMPDEIPIQAVVKDEGRVNNNKGKRPAYKGQRSIVRSYEEAEINQNQMERPSSKESQWQPKPQGSYNKGGWSSQTQGQGEEYGGEEVRRERKPRGGGGGGRIHSPPNNMEDEAVPFDQQQHQQHSSSEFRNYRGGQSNRGGSNNANRERPRHYEYQPVGSNNNNKTGTNVDGLPAGDGSGNNAGPRYKERNAGQQPRRGGGNFYGRQ